jgi:hypothetical protein
LAGEFGEALAAEAGAGHDVAVGVGGPGVVVAAVVEVVVEVPRGVGGDR